MAYHCISVMNPKSSLQERTVRVVNSYEAASDAVCVHLLRRVLWLME